MSETEPGHRPAGGSLAAPLTERGRRKRAAIVAAAREIFEESGFKDARIADIALRAKASYGSFYTYFESKDEIFREVVQEVTDEMFETSRSGSGTVDALTRIEMANRKYVEAFAANARMMGVMTEVAAYDEFTLQQSIRIRDKFVARNSGGIKRLQAEGRADSSVDADIAADILGGMVERFAQVWVANRSPEEIERGIAVLTEIWARGIGLTPLEQGGSASG